MIRGEPHGFPVDIWQFGVLMYELYTGRTPFEERQSACSSSQHAPKNPLQLLSLWRDAFVVLQYHLRIFVIIITIAMVNIGLVVAMLY